MNIKEMLACLTDRPCAVCKYHSDNGCTQWKCVFEEEPCEDAISRQAVISIIQNWLGSDTGYSWGEKNVMLCTIDELRNLPSVSTEKTGRWIEVDVRNCHAALKCSVCDRVIKPTFTFGEYSYEDIKKFYPYCHCGARMGGAEE